MCRKFCNVGEEKDEIAALRFTALAKTNMCRSGFQPRYNEIVSSHSGGRMWRGRLG